MPMATSAPTAPHIQCPIRIGSGSLLFSIVSSTFSEDDSRDCVSDKSGLATTNSSPFICSFFLFVVRSIPKNGFIVIPLLFYIVPHRRFNVNIFAKSLCPILTAAKGYIMGVGAKLFTIAGPVIVYGTVASVVYGIVYWVTTLF
ncbi:MAG: SpoVA/SpoVAEb family sporulation membrane protein [Clostridia bacterium]|nr:SpoVA/SpoVAEb family sporulation membrane protein [Clostridia bacterium]